MPIFAKLLSLTEKVLEVRRILSFWTFAAVSFGPFNSFAASASEPQRLGDWEITCAPSLGSTVLSCKATQRLVVEETDATVFLMTLMPGDGSRAAPIAIVSVPLGGYLVPGIEVSIGDGKPYKLLIETCTVDGCHAGFALSGRIGAELRKGKRAQFRIWTAKNAAVDVNVSLNGFAEAVARLEGRS